MQWRGGGGWVCCLELNGQSRVNLHLRLTYWETFASYFTHYHIIVTACKVAELAWPTSIGWSGTSQNGLHSYFIEERGEKEQF